MQKVSSKLPDNDSAIVTASVTSPMIMNVDVDIVDSEIRKQISKIGVITGITTPPSEEDTSVIIFLIRSQYRTLTIDELSTAFLMNMTGELSATIPAKNASDQNTVRRFEHFNTLSTNYVTNVLNHYRIRKTEAFKKFNILKNAEPVKQIESKPATGEQLYQLALKIIREECRIIDFCDWDSLYLYLEEANIINLTNEEKTKTKARIGAQVAKDHVAKRLAAQTLGEKREVDQMLRPNNIKTLCRKHYVLLHLETVLKEHQQHTQKSTSS